MKRLIAYLMFSVPLMAQAQTLGEWDDVSVTSLQREEAHELSTPFNGTATEGDWVQSLNGTWKFHWSPLPSSAVAGFEREGFDASGWDDIDVPATWQVYGIRHGKAWDKPLYVNTRYPFTYTDTYSVMADRPDNYTYNNAIKNPVGQYRRTFDVPASWGGRDVFLRFNGAGHGYYVWVNGQFAGYAEDSYLPSEFRVTDFVRSGQTNSVAVQVYRFTSGSFLECQDYWRLTGITRDVTLWSAPKSRLHDFFFRTTLLSAGNTRANAAVSVTTEGDDVAGATLRTTILDGGSPIATAERALTAAGTTTLSLRSIAGIEAWSAEHPRLYDLVVELSKDGTTLDRRTCKVGFRVVAVRGDGALTVNGNRIVIHGVNRHDFSQENGRTVSREEMEADVQTMKRLNVNAVRTSHYPNNPYFYELCDRYGLYVLAEADVECHGNTGLSSVELFRQPMVVRSERMVQTLRNHPAIIIWSAGNESGNGNNFQTVMEAIKKLDATRLTHYEGNSQWSDVTSTMYASYSHIKGIGEERKAQYQGGTKPRPHIQCENTHAMGNSMGNQREMFNLYENYAALTGEFVWDWKDQGLRVTDSQTGKDYWAYGGDFGDYPNDGNFNCNGVVLPDGTPTAKSFNMKKIYQPIDIVMLDSLAGTFRLKSKLAHVATDAYTVDYDVTEDGVAIASGTIDAGSIAAGDSVEVKLASLPAMGNAAAEYFIRFSIRQREATLWAEAGYEVGNESFRLRAATSRPAPAVSGSLAVESSGSTVTVRGDHFEAVFSQGTLSKYTYDGQQLINAPLRLNVFRLPTDNDKAQTAAWDETGLRSLTLVAGTCQATPSDDGRYADISVSNRYKGSGTTAFTTDMHFHVTADGTIEVYADIDPAQKGAVLPRMGFRTEMPQGFEQLSWLGCGPWASYRDRKESAHVGLYHSTVAEQFTDFVLPQECGNKEDVRWMAVYNDGGQGLLFAAPQLMSASASHWRAENNYTNRDNRQKHPYQLRTTTSTVVCLDADMRALGNASCGPDVLDQYELRAGRTLMNFIIRPIQGTQTDQRLAEEGRVGGQLCQPVAVAQQGSTITLTTATPGGRIYYSIDGGAEQLYDGPFTLPSGGTIATYATADGLLPSVVTTRQLSFYVDKAAWRILSYDSQQGGGERVENAIDDDPSTIWHTQYNPTTPACPHEIVVDMGQLYRVSAFLYQPRTDMTNGRVADYEVYFSQQPDVWGAPVAKGSFANSSALQRADLTDPVDARYMKLLILSTADNQPFASVAELGIEALARGEATTPQTFFAQGTYRLREEQSGLYLRHRVDTGANHEGDFCLGSPATADDATYLFNFQRAAGFTAHYSVRCDGVYMGAGQDGWRCVGVTTTGTAEGWMQVEQDGDGRIRLRAPWQRFRYMNFDSRNVGSYVYADKTSGAVFVAEPIATAIGALADGTSTSAPVYDLSGRRHQGEHPLPSGIYLQAGRKFVRQ